MSKYGVFSGSYFPAFRLNTERYGVNFCIQSEYGKIRTIKISVFPTQCQMINKNKVIYITDLPVSDGVDDPCFFDAEFLINN